MWQIIRGLVADGVTIFLTTQYLDEADQLADRIAVLDHGRIVAEGSPGELKRRIPGGHIRLQFADPPTWTRRPQVLGPASRDDEALTLQVPSDGSAPVAAGAARPARRRGDRGRRACRSTRPISTTSSSPSPASPSTRKGDPAHEHPRPCPSPTRRTMLRRSLRHMLRYPSMTLLILGMPVVFLLLFVYVFGGTLGAGLGGVADSRARRTSTTSPRASC